MLKVKHRTLIFLAGLVWIVIGIFLLTLGMNFLLSTLRDPSLLYQTHKFSFLLCLSKFFHDTHQALIGVVTVALIVGYVKGRFVLSKSVKRQVARIRDLPDPASLAHLYSKGFYALIASMMLLGILLRFFPITLDTRGAVDVAIGAALINGASLYFRQCTQPKLEKSS